MSVTATLRSPRRTGRPTTVLHSLLGGLALVVAAPALAEAHVELGADTTAAGSTALLTLNVPHGCDGSPTKKIAVAIPTGVNLVTPTVHPGWTVTKKTTKLAAPVSTDENETISSRTSQVVWTARTPLPDGYRDSLSLQVQLPDEAAGRRLAFPTVQTCTTGETDWTQVAAEGEDGDDLEHPAPSITVTATAPDQHHHEDGSAAPARSGSTSPAAVETTEASGSPVEAGATRLAGPTGPTAGWVGLLLGAVGLITGTIALFRTRSVRRADPL